MQLTVLTLSAKGTKQASLIFLNQSEISCYFMHTVNTIRISADPDTVYTTAANLLAWPKILPHYRWVDHVGGQGFWQIYEMAARRSGIPVKWLSLANFDPLERRIYFRHIGGLTRGMEVVWMIDPCQDGTEVRILHEFDRLKVPLVSSCIGKFITSRIFVEHVADETLRWMKTWIEQRAAQS